MTQDTRTTAEVTKEVVGNVSFGPNQLSNPTPKWVSYVVRTLLYITGIWVSLSLGDTLQGLGLTDAQVTRVGSIMTLLTAVASLLGRFTGVQPKDGYIKQ